MRISDWSSDVCSSDLPNLDFSARIRAYREEGMDYRWRFTFQDFSPAFRANPLAEYFANIFKQRDDLCDVDSIVYQFEALSSTDLKGYYNRVRSPVLILTGTEDHIHALAFALRDEIPGSELKILPGAGHACHIEQPWLFDKLDRKSTRL